MQNFQVVTPGQTQTRKNRSPSFPQNGYLYPWGLHPTMIHPVLPGETLQWFQRKMRFVSMPVANPLTGAWLETFLVYVKLTDIDQALSEQFISDDMSPAGYTAGSNSAAHFLVAGDVDWMRMAAERVVDAYFTNENEAPRKLFGSGSSNSPYQAKVRHASFYQNLTFDTDISDPALSGSVGEVSEQISAFRMAQMMEMTEITYEKMLEQYGVQSVRAEKGVPEILRYSREWTLPTNHVDPATGAPTSAWVWNHEYKLDKNKRFTEPGFILELTVIRPKVYSEIWRSAVGSMWGLADWFPAYTLQDPSAGMKKVSTDDPLFTGVSSKPATAKDVWFDWKDLLYHGEQFHNFNPNNPNPAPVVPTMDLASSVPEDIRGEYVQIPASDQYQAFAPLFKNSAGFGDTGIYYDGISQLGIKGHIVDTTR